jgi:hypothetical protein
MKLVLFLMSAFLIAGQSSAFAKTATVIDSPAELPKAISNDEINTVLLQKYGFKEEISKVTDPLEASKISGWCCVLEDTYHCKTTRRDVRSSDYYVLVMLSGSGLANDTVLKNSN